MTVALAAAQQRDAEGPARGHEPRRHRIAFERHSDQLGLHAHLDHQVAVITLTSSRWRLPIRYRPVGSAHKTRRRWRSKSSVDSIGLDGRHPKMPPTPELPELPEVVVVTGAFPSMARMRWSTSSYSASALIPLCSAVGELLRSWTRRCSSRFPPSPPGHTPGSRDRSWWDRAKARLLLAISASLIIVLQAACSAPAPLGATLAIRALSEPRAYRYPAEAGPVHPDGQTVRRRSLLIRTGARREGQSRPERRRVTLRGP